MYLLRCSKFFCNKSQGNKIVNILRGEDRWFEFLFYFWDYNLKLYGFHGDDTPKFWVDQG
jgi:hypothetical protein